MSDTNEECPICSSKTLRGSVYRPVAFRSQRQSDRQEASALRRPVAFRSQRQSDRQEASALRRPECGACYWFEDDADVLYMFVPNNAEWEDLILYRNKEEAIAASIKYYKNTVQIFKRKENSGYEPSYLYYTNGKLKANM